jgi:aspartate aminotransferase-like enzyme
MTNKIYIKKFVTNQNKIKKLLTPGPGSLLPENLISMQPCFGRGDIEYKKIELNVLNRLKNISGHKYIARLQGSASLALEILASNFLYGKVLVIDTGVYSERIKNMSIFSKSTFKNIREVKVLKWEEIKNFSKKFDWIFACPTETSVALRIPIEDLYKLKKRCKAKLALDATASIGLEKNHNFADVLAYSSCKGLFGLTGASFIAFNKYPVNKVGSFYLNIFNHLESRMTGPYHTILSLFKVLPKHNEFKYSVLVNKKKIEKLMGNQMVYPRENQPLLCTYIKKKLISKNKKIIFYETRANLTGTVVCHLGEVHLKKKSKGNILKELIYEY